MNYLEGLKPAKMYAAQQHLLSQCMYVCVIGLQSCLELKNYEAVFALMKGLESRTVQQAKGSWQVQLVMTTQHGHLKAYVSSSPLCTQGDGEL